MIFGRIYATRRELWWKTGFKNKNVMQVYLILRSILPCKGILSSLSNEGSKLVFLRSFTFFTAPKRNRFGWPTESWVPVGTTFHGHAILSRLPSFLSSGVGLPNSLLATMFADINSEGDFGILYNIAHTSKIWGNHSIIVTSSTFLPNNTAALIDTEYILQNFSVYIYVLYRRIIAEYFYDSINHVGTKSSVEGKRH